MKEITKIQTCDGELFSSTLDARRHLQKLESDAIFTVVNIIMSYGEKRKDITEHIGNDHKELLMRLQSLDNIRKDFTTEENEDN